MLSLPTISTPWIILACFVSALSPSILAPVRVIEVHTSTRSRSKQKGKGQGVRPVDMQRSYGSAGGALLRHSLELCREGERQAPPRGQGWIGTLTCTTQVYTEKNWNKEVPNLVPPPLWRPLSREFQSVGRIILTTIKSLKSRQVLQYLNVHGENG